MAQRVGSAVATYRTEPGVRPSYGYVSFYYYGNQHWAPFGREATACGPAAVATAARFQRGRNLGELELRRAVNNLGPAGTDQAGINSMLNDLSVSYNTEWVHGTDSYIEAIRNRITAGRPVIVLVDWGAEPGEEWFEDWFTAHYMVAFGATSSQILCTNYARVTDGRSENYGFSDQRLRDLFSGHLVQAAGFWGAAVGFRLLTIDRPS